MSLVIKSFFDTIACPYYNARKPRIQTKYNPTSRSSEIIITVSICRVSTFPRPLAVVTISQVLVHNICTLASYIYSFQGQLPYKYMTLCMHVVFQELYRRRGGREKKRERETERGDTLIFLFDQRAYLTAAPDNQNKPLLTFSLHSTGVLFQILRRF